MIWDLALLLVATGSYILQHHRFTAVPAASCYSNCHSNIATWQMAARFRGCGSPWSCDGATGQVLMIPVTSRCSPISKDVVRHSTHSRFTSANIQNIYFSCKYLQQSYGFQMLLLIFIFTETITDICTVVPVDNTMTCRLASQPLSDMHAQFVHLVHCKMRIEYANDNVLHLRHILLSHCRWYSKRLDLRGHCFAQLCNSL